MGSMIQKIIAIFFIFVLQGNYIQATFYSPYDFNRHLAHFQRKNYQFWHELYRSNYQAPPFLRYSQPGYLNSGPLNKMHGLGTAPLIPPNVPQFNNNNNNGQNQWNELNDIYGNGYRYPNIAVNDEQSVTSTTLMPSTKRTTRPRTTYTTRERTTVSLSTEATIKPTLEIGSGETSTSTDRISSQKPTKSPSELLAQIDKINNSSQGILSQLGKPTKKTGNGGRPSASQLLQQIQKVNSSAQNLLVTLKPNKVKFQGYEIKDEVLWTTARTTDEETSTLVQLGDITPLVAPAIVLKLEDREEAQKITQDDMTTPSKAHEMVSSGKKMVLVSISKTSGENVESRHSEINLIEATTIPETTTEKYYHDRYEDYELEEIDDTTNKSDDSKQSPMDKRRFDEDITTAEFEEDLLELTTESEISTNAFKEEELPFDEDMQETTTVAAVTETTTIEEEEEETVEQELIEFIILDIVTTASALQSVINSILDPLNLGLSADFTLLETLLANSRKNGKTTPKTAQQISVQITKITSNFGLKRLRSSQISELTQRLNKLGKLLKLSVSNV